MMMTNMNAVPNCWLGRSDKYGQHGSVPKKAFYADENKGGKIECGADAERLGGMIRAGNPKDQR
jgi:hypothetical protein